MTRPPMNHAQLIQKFSSSGQWDRTLDAAREWLAADPENAAAHRAACQALIYLVRYKQAEPHVQAVLARHPEDNFAHRLASIIHFGLKRPKAAEESILKAIALNPRDYRHWQHLAWMCHQQGDRVNGLKWAEKARELAPADAGVLNVLALCQPPTEAGRARKRVLLYEALALRPNDPNLQNNIGILFLGKPQDLAAAEACFRNALTAVPTSPVYRKNLFIAIRGRDWIYRALCAPRDALHQVRAGLRPSGGWRLLLIPFLIIIWLMAARIFVAVLVLWAVLVWPMLKVYEFLIIGDLRKKAGEVGALRGGAFGYRRWSLRVRLGIFGGMLAAFWAAMAYLFLLLRQGSAPVTFALLGAGLVVLGIFIVVRLRGGGSLFPTLDSWQRARKINRVLRTNPTLPHSQPWTKPR
jgi:tetratricopeptide (TPR) repeat protein